MSVSCRDSTHSLHGVVNRTLMRPSCGWQASKGSMHTRQYLTCVRLVVRTLTARKLHGDTGSVTEFRVFEIHVSATLHARHRVT